jgi:hypothetical protein
MGLRRDRRRSGSLHPPPAAQTRAQQQSDAAAYQDWQNRQAQERDARASSEHLDPWGRSPSHPARINAERNEQNFARRQAQADAEQAAASRRYYAQKHRAREPRRQ